MIARGRLSLHDTARAVLRQARRCKTPQEVEPLLIEALKLDAASKEKPCTT